jgi:aminoglycoside phosphotransferase family enzyme/predicted kinase
MLTEDQGAVVDFLMLPSTHGGASVDRIDTHASIVFLAGARAWKLKRAVRYDYLDFSTAERRRTMCEAEVRINRRTAPTLYKGVVAVTRTHDGSLALDGPGAPVDWIIEMVRFDQDVLLDRLAARGALDIELMRPLAAAVARLHETAESRPDRGGLAGLAWVIAGNADGLAREGAGILDPAACAGMTGTARDELARLGPRLEARRSSGLVRQCHGDLHLRNIVLIDGVPTLFDGIEFNDDLACIDVLYDLAFLLMDLWRRGLTTHAHRALNAYLGETGDLEGVDLLPLLLSCRAAVRAKTTATAAGLTKDRGQRDGLERQAREYLELAASLLAPRPAVLVAVGGLSGSGKSTVAFGLGPSLGVVPGAIVLRSDEIRKQLGGVSPLSRLGPDAYTPEMSRSVYAALSSRAATLLGQGHAVIADAVFARPDDRAAIEATALAADVPFVGLWLEAPADTLVSRTGTRGPDVSDADAQVVRRQLAQDVGPLTWHRLDASPAPDVVTARALSMVQDATGASGLAG